MLNGLDNRGRYIPDEELLPLTGVGVFNVTLIVNDCDAVMAVFPAASVAVALPV